MKAVYGSIFLAIWLFMGCNSADKHQREQENTGIDEKTFSKEKAGSISWIDYVSEDYQFSISYPSRWIVKEFTFGGDQKIVNILSEKDRPYIDLPIAVHADAGVSYAGIYPDGYGTELPMGRSMSLHNEQIKRFDFSVNREKSQVFLLENDEIWGFFIVPSSPPESWDEYGFVFAQIRVNDFRLECYEKETGRKIGMRECDPMMGDIIKRFGQVDDAEKHLVYKILSGFTFR